MSNNRCKDEDGHYEKSTPLVASENHVSNASFGENECE